MEKNMTEIYITNTNFLNSSEFFYRYFEGLPEYRQKKIMSLKNNSDRVLSLGAGALIAHGLQKLGISAREAEYAFGEYGKPYLKNHPEIHFSVSHSRDMVMCAFSSAEVGCDMEFVGDCNWALAKRYFSEKEREYILKRGNRGFFKVWTLRESLGKTTGEGVKIMFKDLSVDMKENICVLENKKYYFREYDFGEYVGTCCCERSGFPDEPEFVMLK